MPSRPVNPGPSSRSRTTAPPRQRWPPPPARRRRLVLSAAAGPLPGWARGHPPTESAWQTRSHRRSRCCDGHGHGGGGGAASHCRVTVQYCHPQAPSLRPELIVTVTVTVTVARRRAAGTVAHGGARAGDGGLGHDTCHDAGAQASSPSPRPLALEICRRSRAEAAARSWSQALRVSGSDDGHWQARGRRAGPGLKFNSKFTLPVPVQRLSPSYE